MHQLHRPLPPLRTVKPPGRRRRASTIALTPIATFLVLASAVAAQADTTRTDAAAPQSTSERRLNPQPEPPGVAARRGKTRAASPSAKSPKADLWRRVVTKRYTPATLGLARDVSTRALARAAIERSARSLGVRRRAGIRFASEFAPPAAPAGARQLRTLRFRQTVGGLRVLWSEIDVAVVEDAVTSISATTVPFTHARLEGRRRVTRARARAVAKRAQPGAEQALPAQPVAYAGTPGKPWTPRRAWVVQLEPAKQDRGADDTKTICVVVDAASGKVLMRYEGSVAQGTRSQRGAPRAQSATAPVFGTIFDAGGGTGQGQAIASWTGDPRPGGTTGVQPWLADWASRPGATQAVFGVNVFLSACRRRGFCAAHTVVHGQHVGAQTIVANSSDPIGSHYSRNSGIITLETKHADNDDVIAHELGHRRDFTWADDRVNGPQQVDEVEEALADMFAFDFDFDPSMFEDFIVNYPGDEEKTGNRRDLKQPSTYSRDGAPYPDTMSQYRCDPTTDEHINATILGHAYYLFATNPKVGHDVAGDVLTYIPYALPPAPSFNDVAYWFSKRSEELYGQTVAAAANHAFRTLAGIGIQTPHGKGCDLKPTPKPPPSDKVCENKMPPPPECFTQSPPTRPELDPTE